MAGTTITVNGARHAVQAPLDTPLPYVLRNDLGLSGAHSSAAAFPSAEPAPCWSTARRNVPV